MHSRFRSNGVSLTALAALLALLVLPGSLLALPKPGAPRRSFRLMARAIGAMTVNRAYCGLSSTGEVCVDSSGSSTIGGGFWPKGGPQQYVFNSGLQVAGSVDTAATFGWKGDTTGAFFFDPKGTTQHGSQVEPIWNAQNSTDLANWPDAAKVPAGDAVADLYDVNLQGRNSASQGDIWTIAWDGDPGQNAGRKHPLGIAVETRGMGWNYPTFNNDIVYFVYTFYNVTAADPAAYVNIRPELRPTMQALGVQFQALNDAAFGVAIPNGGYTINNFYANFAADMDVSSSAGSNYASVNLPFSLGYTYQVNFQSPDNGFRLPPDLGSAPFINGYGFVGVKYLKSPVDPITNQEIGIKLFSNSVNGGLFGDPQNAQQLFRYLSGTMNAALGDGNCNYNPATQRICYVKNDGSADMRFFQSSGPFDLAPGQFGSIVVAYEFASAVAAAGCPAANCTIVGPGSATLPSNADSLHNQGANLVDSLTGFAGYTDLNADGIVQQGEVKTVKGSLLAKALVAQTVFDNKFLLPAAPESPDFFLVPGDNQVTVVWRKSNTEVAGDLFFAAANNPGTVATPNLLYDPNYRQFDVEGYRVYRGRVDNPSTLTLLAQFDYNTTTMADYLGVINPDPGCAPELGNQTSCPVTFTTPAAGNPYIAHQDYAIVSPFVQVKIGNRTLLATGDAIILSADTAVTGTESGSYKAELSDNGVPFVYNDLTAKNNLRYFYAVTAFDVNSIQSGPSSLESARVTKAATPVHAASNYHPDVATSVMIRGRGVLKDPNAPLPTIDANGEFSGPMPAADGAGLGLVGSFVREVVAGSGAFFARLDSLRMGQVDLSGCCGAGGGAVISHYFWTVSNGTTSTQLDLPMQQDLANAQSQTGLFDGITVNNGLGGQYGGGNSFSLLAAVKPTMQPVGYAGGSGLAAALGSAGFTAASFAAAGTTGFRYDGFRWYDGANEATADPTSPGTCGTGTAACGNTPGIANLSNAGAVTGATLVYMPHSYRNINREWRNVEAITASAARAADMRVYWGAAGVVDSVIDLTNNVPLTWDSTRLGAGWAILNTANTGTGSQDNRAGVLTPADWMCIEPFFSQIPMVGFFPCTTLRTVSKVAALGAVAAGAGDNQGVIGNSWRNPANSGGNGFSMYLAGTITIFGGMAALPANTTWTLRTYSGVIFGGKGSTATTGNPGVLGPYRFISKPRPMTAVGAEVVFNYNVTQTVTAPTVADLDHVHTVPDPYYVTNGFERTTTSKVIKFVNLPEKAIVRIYSTSGVLVRVLEHTSITHDGSLDWDVRNRNNQVVASGVYFYAIESESGARRVGRMTIVNFAQ